MYISQKKVKSTHVQMTAGGGMCCGILYYGTSWVYIMSLEKKAISSVRKIGKEDTAV